MAIAARINQTKYDVFRWRYELSIPKKLALALGMAALTGLLAQARVQLPWSPVPVTGQTFAVLLAGVLLGRWWGGISLAIYTGLGMAGVPWFAGLNGGLGLPGRAYRRLYSRFYTGCPFPGTSSPISTSGQEAS